MIATAFPRQRKPRGRRPLSVVCTITYVRVPVAEFARGWAPVIARTAARLAATTTQGIP